MSYQITFYDLPQSGRYPVEEFLDDLIRDNPKLHAKTVRNIELLSTYGLSLGMPYVRSLEDGIYELRSEVGSNASRILYFLFLEEQNTIVMTNGFLRKSQKTPQKELEKAKRYKKEYESR